MFTMRPTDFWGFSYLVFLFVSFLSVCGCKPTAVNPVGSLYCTTDVLVFLSVLAFIACFRTDNRSPAKQTYYVQVKDSFYCRLHRPTRRHPLVKYIRMSYICGFNHVNYVIVFNTRRRYYRLLREKKSDLQLISFSNQRVVIEQLDGCLNNQMNQSEWIYMQLCVKAEDSGKRVCSRLLLTEFFHTWRTKGFNVEYSFLE